jgi:hypothetical protein
LGQQTGGLTSAAEGGGGDQRPGHRCVHPEGLLTVTRLAQFGTGGRGISQVHMCWLMSKMALPTRTRDRCQSRHDTLPTAQAVTKFDHMETSVDYEQIAAGVAAGTLRRICQMPNDQSFTSSTPSSTRSCRRRAEWGRQLRAAALATGPGRRPRPTMHASRSGQRWAGCLIWVGGEGGGGQRRCQG